MGHVFGSVYRLPYRNKNKIKCTKKRVEKKRKQDSVDQRTWTEASFWPWIWEMFATTAWYMAGTVIIPETLTGYAITIKFKWFLRKWRKGDWDVNTDYGAIILTLAIFACEKYVVLPFLPHSSLGDCCEVHCGDCWTVRGICKGRDTVRSYASNLRSRNKLLKEILKSFKE